MKKYTKILFDLVQFDAEDVMASSGLNAQVDATAKATIDFSELSTSSAIVISKKADLNK